MTKSTVPNILTIAGTDSSGGAGVPADIKAISACGGYAMCVVTAVTAQNTVGVQQVELMPMEIIKAQIDSVFSDVRVHAVKIGMLGNADIIEAVSERLIHYQNTLDYEFKIVLDTLMVAKSGDRLLADEAVSALKDKLLPIVTVVTPNLPEAGDLLGEPEAQSKDDMLAQAKEFDVAVYLKGGHLQGQQAADVLFAPNDNSEPSTEYKWFASKRIDTNNTHGTGCTLSASIATFLGKGQPLDVACANAKDYMTEAIRHADELDVGQGHGPVNHFHMHHAS